MVYRNINEGTDLINYEAILTEAHNAAREAVAAEVARRPEDERDCDCGFAWVTVEGNEAIARHCRAKLKDTAPAHQIKGDRSRYGDKGYPKGWQWWKPGNFRGLAAPQVGVCVRMFAMRLGDRLAVICNPMIVRHGKDVVTDVEGCLSIPGKRLRVPRYNIIEVDCFDITGVHKPPLKLRGIDARCAQHEIDHLSGKLITEY